MAAFTLDPLRDPRWAAFVERHPDASGFHSTGWLEALHRAYGYEPVVYTTSPPTQELTTGLVFCRIHSWLTGRRLVSLPFSDHCNPLVEREGDLDELLSSLERSWKRENWRYVEMRPLGRWGGSARFSKSDVFAFHHLDLRAPEEALLRSLHRDCIRRKIRRAARETLTYEEGRSEVVLRKFYRLLLLTCRRRRLPPQPVDWFRHVVACLGDRATIHLASLGERPVASILTIRFKGTLIYKYGCSDPRLSRLGGTQLVLWNAIRSAKREGLQAVDLGRSDAHASGLVAFKERWGATRSTLEYWRWSASGTPNACAGSSLTLARSVFARMPERLLVAAGQMLYRHVG